MFTLEYHDATKHDFHRFARSLGYLDWATQPDPFRRFPGAPAVPLARSPLRADVPYSALYDGIASPAAVDDASVSELLRCAFGLSAWKRYQSARWALRVNPSSGNLHPTEAYLVYGGRIFHYAPRDHALEERAVLHGAAWQAFTRGAPLLLVGLSSIHWREAWKYGERAFRYCQHDTGHAIGAARFAAALLGWRLAVLPEWSDADIAALLGLDRDGDFGAAEREEPECLLAVSPVELERWTTADRDMLVAAARRAAWRGIANQLSPSRVEWPIIERVAAATRSPGGASHRVVRDRPPSSDAPPSATGSEASARSVILRRRSAVAFDARSSLPRARLLSMLARLHAAAAPWDALSWPRQVQLVLFVHRVDGLVPGVYAYLRDPSVRPDLQAAMRPEFLWEGVDAGSPLFLLLPQDVTWVASRLSCDQDIAGDGFFSLGMLAPLARGLGEHGEPFYRRLFWECGVVGQVLYLEAEAAGARGTGIGCYYDDRVHEALGLRGPAWQSLYHFAMGVPVEDSRLTTEPGYPWEAG